MNIIIKPSSGKQESDPLFAIGHRFLIHDPNRIWVIETGKVDIYVADAVDGKPKGAYHHVIRLDAGQAVFGIDPKMDGTVALIACPSPDSVLSSSSIFSFRDTAMENHTNGNFSCLLEDWICSLSEIASNKNLPKEFFTIAKGEDINVDDNDKILLPKTKVLWLRQMKGASFVHDDANQSIPCEIILYPISKFGWVKAQPGSEIQSYDTDTVLQQENVFEGLQEFHKNSLASILRYWRESEEKANRRLRDKSETDRETLEHALLELTQPLSNSSDEIVELGDAHDPPLVKACQIIGNSMGVSMKLHPDALRHINKKDIVTAIAKASGIQCRKVVLRDKWWKQGGGALLAFRDSDQSPLAIIPGSSNNYRVYDLESSRAVKIDREIIDSLNPIAYSFYRPFPNKPLSIRDILNFGIRGAGIDILFILLMGIAMGAFAIMTPFATGIIFDSLIPGARRTELLIICGFLMVVSISTNLFNLTRSLAILRLKGKMGTLIQAAIWDRLLRLPVSFFRDFTTGDLAARCMGFLEVRQILTGITLDSLLSGIFSVFSFSLMFYYSWKLAIVGSLLSFIALLVTVLYGFYLLENARKSREQSGIISGRVLELIMGIAKFRIARAEKRAFAMWAREFAKQKKIDYKGSQINNWLKVFHSSYLLLCLIVLFWVNATYFHSRGEPLSIGSLLAFLATFSQFSIAILALGSAVISILSIVPIFEQARPIFTATPEENIIRTDPGELTGIVEANHLIFRYRHNSPVILNDLSFSVEPGQFIAFVGPSGCGKSTLFRLLLGFEIAESGAIYYDKQDIAGVDIQAVRQQIGVVLQNSTLISGSIYDNISGGNFLTIENAWEAAKHAGLDDDIHNMAMGMYTMIQEGGVGLSGGQRQRILIARAIAKKPRILMMDEATSALDNRTQAIVTESLRSLKSTRIVIAHRLSTIIDADCIYVMDRGRIVQSGSYQELMSQQGLFRDFANRQLV